MEITYIPGPENLVADALSRWAYPASSAREDVSLHGSLEACKEVKKMMLKEATVLKDTAVLRFPKSMERKSEQKS